MRHSTVSFLTKNLFPPGTSWIRRNLGVGRVHVAPAYFAIQPDLLGAPEEIDLPVKRRGGGISAGVIDIAIDSAGGGDVGLHGTEASVPVAAVVIAVQQLRE